MDRNNQRNYVRPRCSVLGCKGRPFFFKEDGSRLCLKHWGEEDD